MITGIDPFALSFSLTRFNRFLFGERRTLVVVRRSKISRPFANEIELVTGKEARGLDVRLDDAIGIHAPFQG